MKYREDTPLVLKNMSFTIQAGERIGIVGRTGSGKSSLFQALLRLVQPESGSMIKIGGQDTKKLTMRALRASIAIVPQQSVIFSGTLRSNLDPFGEYSDNEMWGALDKVGMKSTVSAYPEKLESPVTESGGNYSAGERQLLCLARAILNDASIILLDEATSALDGDSDDKVQKALRQFTHKPTVITIAHRVNTISDSDRIMALRDGSVVEFDAPAVLLADPLSELSLAMAENQKKEGVSETSSEGSGDKA